LHGGQQEEEELHKNRMAVREQALLCHDQFINVSRVMGIVLWSLRASPAMLSMCDLAKIFFTSKFSFKSFIFQ